MDRALHALGRPRRMSSFQWGYYGATLAYDLWEGLRAGGRLSRPGRAHLAALASPMRLEQDPRYRAYWYDADRHALVGALLGVDLHRHAGRHYVLETNLTAGLKTERRALYEEPVDPLVSGLLRLAEGHGFRRIVLPRAFWSRAQQRELAAASRSGIEVAPASVMRQRGEAPIGPISALPRTLEPDTLYAVCTALSDSAIFEFLHHKAQLDRWLPEAIAAQGGAVRRLAAVPSAEGPDVPALSDDPRWPNLVVKLANSDMGRDVLMGRFSSPEAARRALGLPADGRGLPRPFLRRPDRRAIDRLFPGALSAVHQSFVPPEVVDGRPRIIRMLSFVSPLADAFLSGHATVGGEALPDAIPLDALLERSPFAVRVPPGRHVRLEPEAEAELPEVSREFGAAVRTAVGRRFAVATEGWTGGG